MRLPLIRFSATALGVCILVLGCGGPAKDAYGVGKTVPVSGKVTFATKLPKDAAVGVVFIADGARSGSSNLPSSGGVDEQGNYTLSTGSQAGAPVGRYKVRVTATMPTNPKDPYSPTRSVIKEIYSDANTTPLSVEVVENPAPGAYDLTVK